MPQAICKVAYFPLNIIRSSRSFLAAVSSMAHSLASLIRHVLVPNLLSLPLSDEDCTYCIKNIGFELSVSSLNWDIGSVLIPELSMSIAGGAPSRAQASSEQASCGLK